MVLDKFMQEQEQLNTSKLDLQIICCLHIVMKADLDFCVFPIEELLVIFFDKNSQSMLYSKDEFIETEN